MRVPITFLFGCVTFSRDRCHRPLKLSTWCYPSRLARARSSASRIHHLPMNDSSGTRLQLLFDTALQSYEKQTGLRLVGHPLAKQLEECRTADRVMDILQHQVWAFTKFREHSGKTMGSIKRVVHVLHELTASTSLGEGIGLVRLTQFLFPSF